VPTLFEALTWPFVFAGQDCSGRGYLDTKVSYAATP
jgi:hypothetical protein